LCGPGTAREGPGYGRGSANFPGCAGPDGGSIGSEHDLPVEQREKRDEVTAARRRKEGVDNFSLTGEIDVGDGGRAALHPAVCAAGQLPRRGGGASNDRRDLVEGMANQRPGRRRQKSSSP